MDRTIAPEGEIGALEAAAQKTVTGYLVFSVWCLF
jgi:hypothetical protein